MRLEIQDGGQVNLNWLEFESVIDSSPSPGGDLHWLPCEEITTENIETITLPLQVHGREIVDQNCNRVLLRGANWWGAETTEYAPQGLDINEYTDILESILYFGFNTLRLPFSLQTNEGTPSEIGYFGDNQNLQNKEPMEILKIIVEEAERNGLMIILDFHTFTPNLGEGHLSTITGLWYDDEHSEEDWINYWEEVANYFKDNKNVIGVELKNEPHWPSTWGTGNDETDWNKAAERAAEAIHDIQPEWLIIVQGIGSRVSENEDHPVPGQILPGHWWGGNLEGVRTAPVEIERQHKLVYSVHEYGASFHVPDWINDPSFPNNLEHRWENGFYYIMRENIAPVIITEFGAYEDTGNSKDAIWQREFIDFIKEENLSFTYWSFNYAPSPSHSIFNADWETIQPSKQDIFRELLPVPTFTPPTGI